MTSSSNNTDKPTKKITPSALRNSIELLEKPVSEHLYQLINNLSLEQIKVFSESYNEIFNDSEKDQYTEINYDKMRKILINTNVQDKRFVDNMIDKMQEGSNDDIYMPLIEKNELYNTAIFLQRAKEVIDTNLQISEDDKIELLLAGKNALEEMANIAKKRGWGEMDIPELEFKEPLRVAETSNAREVK